MADRAKKTGHKKRGLGRGKKRPKSTASQAEPQKSTASQASAAPPAAAPASAAQTPTTTFHRFLELAPELRDRIYSIAVHPGKGWKRNVAAFIPPAITRVSRLVRAESLAIFFAESPWVAMAGLQWNEREDGGSGGSWSTDLGTAPQTEEILQDIGKAGAFGNVEIRMRRVGVELFSTDESRESSACEVLRLSARPTPRLEAEESTDPYIRMRGSATSPDHISEANALVEKIGSKGGFRGFTLRDIEQIIHILRWG